MFKLIELILFIFTFLVGNINAGSVCNLTFIKDWGGNKIERTSHVHLVPYGKVIIHHTLGIRCYNQIICSAIVKNIQDYSMNTDCHDINYNFLIGEDFNVYTSPYTFYNYAGCHTNNHNEESISIAFIGDFQNEVPRPKALELMKEIIECGIETGRISENYLLYGARTLNPGLTNSPGNELFEKLQLLDPNHFND